MLALGVILKDILLPILVIMFLGFWMQKKFQLNVQTLARLNIYFLVPAFIFVKLYSTTISVSLFGNILLFFILYIVILYIISHFIGNMLQLGKGEKTTFSNSIMFFNSGNYGVPVNDLVFRGDPFAMSIQVIMLTLQNVFLFSYGIFSLQSVKIGKLRAMLGYFKMPVLYAMLTGILLNYFNIDVPSFIWTPANYIAEAMIALALFTLGAQVAQIKFTSTLSTLYYSLALRLVIGPFIAFIIIYIFQVEGIVAQALLIGSAMPTSVNSAVIAQEYDNHPDLAAQIVLFSTLVSAITVSLVIFMAKILF